MSIELPAEEVRALGRSLSASAGTADDLRARLTDDGDVEGPLAAPVAAFLDGHATLATALAAELGALGATVSAVADSWRALDAALLPTVPGR